MAGFLSRISGKRGEVRIESLGVLVGTFASWLLTRHGEDGGPTGDLYDLRAAFSYVNPHLWGDNDYVKTITIEVGGKTYRLEEAEGCEVILGGRENLTMKGVRLCQ